MIKYLFLLLVKLIASIFVMVAIIANYFIKGIIVAVRIVMLGQTLKEADEGFDFAEAQVEILRGNLETLNLRKIGGFGGKKHLSERQSPVLAYRVLYKKH